MSDATKIKKLNELLDLQRGVIKIANEHQNNPPLLNPAVFRSDSHKLLKLITQLRNILTS